MTLRPFLCTLLLWIVSTGACLAQVPGVVWQPPADIAEAEQALLEMHDLGVRAVRTGLIDNSRLLFLADTLGIRFYQDLPLQGLTAAQLRDSVDVARERLTPALRRAQIHPSARHFGLARYSDTGDTTACAYFEQLTAWVRQQGPPGSRTYYSTPLVEADRCAATVDEVLLHTLDAADPVDRLRRWQAAHETPAGLGGLGAWVRAAAPAGLRVPHSAEAQARYLENHLGALDTLSASPTVVFVHRWRDVRTQEPSPALDVSHPTLRPYGLYAADGARRPAYDVVRGFFTGGQQVFAFAEGPPREASGAPWTVVLLGWGVFALVGIFYALSPRFRHMVPRYFRAHNFYQEAVREGRDVLLGASLVLLVALGISFGVVVYVAGQVLRFTPPFVLLVQWLPDGLQTLVMGLLEQPWLLIGVAGALSALGLIVWSGLLALLSRRRYALAPGQALMLAVWPRWPHLLGLGAALVALTLPPTTAATVVTYLLLGWVVVALYATGRTVYDYVMVTRIPFGFAPLLVALQPMVLALMVLAVLAAGHRDALAFLMRLW